MSNWISVEDELPISQDYQSALLGCEVLVSDGVSVYSNTYAIGGNHIGRPWGAFSDDMNNKITHWMPLPEPPKDTCKSCGGVGFSGNCDNCIPY
tara:strand:+ start:234 stop:515 length:282 start_codon:yes stop_codon:yes gene_type:complete